MPQRCAKKDAPKLATPPLQIPPRGTDPAERKRQLNVDAQRRYRQRKREYVRQLEAKLQQPETENQCIDRPYNALGKSKGNSGESSVAKLFDELDCSPSSQEWGLDGTTTTCIDPMSLQAGDGGFDFEFVDTESIADRTEAVLDYLPSLSPFPATIDLLGIDRDTLVTKIGLDDGESSAIMHQSKSSASVAKYSHNASLSFVPSNANPSSNAFADEAFLAVFELSILRGSKAIAQRLQISLDVLWDFEAQSPFTDPANAQLSYSHLPLSLQPTPAQRWIPHHPMLDLLPWPEVRTRVLIMFHQPSELRPPAARSETALLDMINDSDDGAEGMKVWGDDPFDVRNWEIGEKVWSRWWWAFDGEIVKQSNRWRHGRGAPLLRRGTIYGGKAE